MSTPRNTDDAQWATFADESPIYAALAAEVFNEQLRDVDSLADLGWIK